MIKDSADKEFEFVIVYKLDRFSRNRYDSAVNKAALKKNGVKVLSATEQITDTPEGVILEALLEGFAEYYSAELSQKVKRGIIETRRKGLFTGGHVNFGYKIVDRKWTIVENEAKIIRKIFLYYLEGMQTQEISDKINKSKTVIGLDRKFGAKELVKMLRNKRYIGIIEGDKIYKNIIPAIIKEDVFHKVGERLDDNKHRPAHFGAKEKYILSGKLFCGCGALMTAETGRSKTKRIYRYYKCVNRRLHKTCDVPALPKLKIEKLVVERIYRFINDEGLCSYIEKYHGEVKKNSLKSLYPKINHEKKQLLKKLESFKNIDTNILDQKYGMINSLVNKITYSDGAFRVYLNFMEIELQIVFAENIE